jgi:hypothetical protein
MRSRLAAELDWRKWLLLALGGVSISYHLRICRVVTIAAPREQRFVLHNIEWAAYRVIANVLGESHVRLTYDEGELELMTLSHGHEHYSKLLGQFVEVPRIYSTCLAGAGAPAHWIEKIKSEPWSPISAITSKTSPQSVINTKLI